MATNTEMTESERRVFDHMAERVDAHFNAAGDVDMDAVVAEAMEWADDWANNCNDVAEDRFPVVAMFVMAEFGAD